MRNNKLLLRLGLIGIMATSPSFNLIAQAGQNSGKTLFRRHDVEWHNTA